MHHASYPLSRALLAATLWLGAAGCALSLDFDTIPFGDAGDATDAALDGAFDVPVEDADTGDTTPPDDGGEDVGPADTDVHEDAPDGSAGPPDTGDTGPDTPDDTTDTHVDGDDGACTPSAEDCGGCGLRCVPPVGVEALCVSNRCTITACPAGARDLNQQFDDGCEFLVEPGPAYLPPVDARLVVPLPDGRSLVVTDHLTLVVSPDGQTLSAAPTRGIPDHVAVARDGFVALIGQVLVRWRATALGPVADSIVIGGDPNSLSVHRDRAWVSRQDGGLVPVALGTALEPAPTVEALLGQDVIRVVATADAGVVLVVTTAGLRVLQVDGASWIETSGSDFPDPLPVIDTAVLDGEAGDAIAYALIAGTPPVLVTLRRTGVEPMPSFSYTTAPDNLVGIFPSEDGAFLWGLTTSGQFWRTRHGDVDHELHVGRFRETPELDSTLTGANRVFAAGQAVTVARGTSWVVAGSPERGATPRWTPPTDVAITALTWAAGDLLVATNTAGLLVLTEVDGVLTPGAQLGTAFSLTHLTAQDSVAVLLDANGRLLLLRRISSGNWEVAETVEAEDRAHFRDIRLRGDRLLVAAGTRGAQVRRILGAGSATPTLSNVEATFGISDGADAYQRVDLVEVLLEHVAAVVEERVWMWPLGDPDAAPIRPLLLDDRENEIAQRVRAIATIGTRLVVVSADLGLVAFDFRPTNPTPFLLIASFFRNVSNSLVADGGVFIVEDGNYIVQASPTRGVGVTLLRPPQWVPGITAPGSTTTPGFFSPRCPAHTVAAENGQIAIATNCGVELLRYRSP